MIFKLRKEGRSLDDNRKVTKGALVIKSKCGIKVLHEPSDAIVDLVFVHGITGHRDYTWSANQNSEPWPKLMLPTRIPEARILTFGYDASAMAFWRGISENSISDHASNLLSTLSCFRSSAEFRPIIFIAHSLGGLVVMDALLSSRTSSEPHLRRILDCVRAILFLGTPHYGVALADTGRRLVGLVSLTAAKTNMKIVSVLQRDSEVLSRIQKGFHELLRSQQRDRTHALEITCCYEELPLIGNTVVVPRESAILRGYSAIGIHADHRGIARFASADDPGFISVLGELRRWTDKVAYADDHHDKELWDIEGKQSHDVLCGWECKRRGNDEGCRDASAGAITIWGDVTKSIIANGDHVIHGNLTFGGS